MILTPKQKLVFQMYHRLGVSQAEIARRLNIDPAAVCSLLKRARQRIHKLVRVYDGHDVEGLINAELASAGGRPLTDDSVHTTSA
jgi:DNA-binding transcriptional regulator LsrR (DeoR family)